MLLLLLCVYVRMSVGGLFVLMHAHVGLGNAPKWAATVRQLALEYLELAALYPPPDIAGGFDCVRRHIAYMLGRQGRGTKLRFRLAPRGSCPRTLRDGLLQCGTVEELAAVLNTILCEPT